MIAAAANHGWTEAHFLPAWAWSWDVQLWIVGVLRFILALVGLLLIAVVGPSVARGVAAGRGREILVTTVSSLIAVAAAFVATEGVLRTQTWHSVQERSDLAEPMRVRDPVLGWGFRPHHAGV